MNERIRINGQPISDDEIKEFNDKGYVMYIHIENVSPSTFPYPDELDELNEEVTMVGNDLPPKLLDEEGVDVRGWMDGWLNSQSNPPGEWLLRGSIPLPPITSHWGKIVTMIPTLETRYELCDSLSFLDDRITAETPEVMNETPPVEEDYIDYFNEIGYQLYLEDENLVSYSRRFSTTFPRI